MDIAKYDNITSGTSALPLNTVKDSVFRDLFSMPEYLLELYKSLHPEDDTVTVADLGNVTIRNILMGTLYNDLGFTARDKLLVMLEAQSTWSINILIRIFMYLADIWKACIIDTRQNMYSSRRMSLPAPEFYVVYTGDRQGIPEWISLSDEFLGGNKEYLELRARVIRLNGSGDIIDQYITFTRIYDEQINKHGRTEKAIRETIRICTKKDILRKYLKDREKEVIDIMTTLFDQEYWTGIYGMEQRAEGRAEGRIEGRAEGRAESQRKSAVRMHEEGLPLSVIARCLDTSIDTVSEWLSESIVTA